MSDNIQNMDFKKLRNEVQLLRDELAIMKRKYEDILYNLDDDNFSSQFLKEKDNMKTEISVTEEGIKTIVSEFVDVSQAIEVDSPNDFKNTNSIYVIRDNNTETFYYYNVISNKWEVVKESGMLNSLFEQTSDGFKLKGTVKVDGSCILTDSLTFDSSDRPVQVEYSIDGVSNWHTTFNSGSDKFMRLKIGSQWSDAMKVVGSDGNDGSDANVTPQKIFNILTNDGAQQGIFNAFVNNNNQLYINAEMIQAGIMRGMTFQNTTGTTSLLLGHESGSDFGDLRLVREDSGGNSTTIFKVKDNLTSIDLVAMGSSFLTATVSKTLPQGTWDFSSCIDVQGLDKFVSGSGGTAVFG